MECAAEFSPDPALNPGKSNSIVVSHADLPVKVDDLARFVLIGREKLVAVRAGIRAMDRINIAGAVREQKLQEASQLAETLLDAETRLGTLLSEIPKAQGKRTDKELGNGGVTKYEAVEELGFNKMTASRFEALAAHPEAVEAAKARATEEERLVTRQDVFDEIKSAAKAEREAVIDEVKNSPIVEPEGIYRTIVIDPPWPYDSKYDPESRRVANPYPSMSIEEIGSIHLPCHDDCILWLWTTHAFLESAFNILNLWGFTHKATMVWDKEKLGVGYWLRMQCEFVLLASRGKPEWNSTNIRDIIREPRREHSRKPESFYQMVEKSCPANRLDYFSRTKRDGFTSYGNEPNKYVLGR